MKSLWFLVLFGLLGLPSGGMAMIATLPVEKLVIQSEQIVKVTLKSVKDAGKDQAGFPLKAHELQVTEALKGTLAKDALIMVETVAGLEDQPVFETGQTYLLFLEPISKNVFRCVNLVQGWWPIDAKGAFMGFGLGVAPEKLLQVIIETKDQKPVSASESVPEF